MQPVKPGQPFLRAHPNVSVRRLGDGLDHIVRQPILGLPGARGIGKYRLIHAEPVEPVKVGADLAFVLDGGVIGPVHRKDLQIAVLVPPHHRVGLYRPPQAPPGRPVFRTVRHIFPAVHHVKMLVVHREHFQPAVRILTGGNPAEQGAAKIGPRRPADPVGNRDLMNAIQRRRGPVHRKHLQPPVPIPVHGKARFNAAAQVIPRLPTPRRTAAVLPAMHQVSMRGIHPKQFHAPVPVVRHHQSGFHPAAQIRPGGPPIGRAGLPAAFHRAADGIHREHFQPVVRIDPDRYRRAELPSQIRPVAPFPVTGGFLLNAF